MNSLKKQTELQIMREEIECSEYSEQEESQPQPQPQGLISSTAWSQLCTWIKDGKGGGGRHISIELMAHATDCSASVQCIMTMKEWPADTNRPDPLTVTTRRFDPTSEKETIDVVAAALMRWSLGSYDHTMRDDG